MIKFLTRANQSLHDEVVILISEICYVWYWIKHETWVGEVVDITLVGEMIDIVWKTLLARTIS